MVFLYHCRTSQPEVEEVFAELDPSLHGRSDVFLPLSETSFQTWIELHRELYCYIRYICKVYVYTIIYIHIIITYVYILYMGHTYMHMDR